MKTKQSESQVSNVNTNSNVSNVNVKVNVTDAKRRSNPKKPSKAWRKVLFAAIVTTLLSIGGYYLKKKIDEKGNPHPTELMK